MCIFFNLLLCTSEHSAKYAVDSKTGFKVWLTSDDIIERLLRRGVDIPEELRGDLVIY